MEGINWNLLLSIAATLIAVSGWITTLKKVSMAEGKHLGEVEDMDKRIEGCEKQGVDLKRCAEENKLGINSLQTDMRWVRDALDEIKSLIKNGK